MDLFRWSNSLPPLACWLIGWVGLLGLVGLLDFTLYVLIDGAEIYI